MPSRLHDRQGDGNLVGDRRAHRAVRVDRALELVELLVGGAGRVECHLHVHLLEAGVALQPDEAAQVDVAGHLKKKKSSAREGNRSGLLC